MKRYRFVLVLLMLTIAATGCRRRCNLFGRRGAPCQSQTVYSQNAAAATTGVVCPTCPTVCPDNYGGEVYGGEVYGGEVLGESIDGAIIDSGFSGGEVYNGAALPSTTVPAFGKSDPFGDIAPMLGSSSANDVPYSGGFGRQVYGRSAFQVVGDRKLNPGESLPPLDDDETPSTQSDKTAQAPKK